MSLVNKRPDAPSAARTAVGVSSTEVYLVVLTTSNQSFGADLPMKRHGAEEFSGLPLWAFADFMVGLGAQEVLNMDGGISAAFRARLNGQDYVLSGGPGTINAVKLSGGL